MVLTATLHSEEDNLAENTALNAFGGGAVAFVGSGYVGAIYGGLGQMLNYAIFEHGKTASTNVYYKMDRAVEIAYKIDEYHIVNPYNNNKIWVGTYKSDGDTYRDIEGRLMVIRNKKP